MRSVYLHKNKDVFKVSELPLDEFAASLGLPGAPKVKFAKAAAPGSKKPKAKSTSKHVKFGNDSDSSDDENNESSSVSSEHEDEEDVGVDSQASVAKRKVGPKHFGSCGSADLTPGSLLSEPSTIEFSKGRTRTFFRSTIPSLSTMRKAEKTVTFSVPQVIRKTSSLSNVWTTSYLRNSKRICLLLRRKICRSESNVEQIRKNPWRR